MNKAPSELITGVAIGGGLIRLGWELYLGEKICVRRVVGSVMLASMLSVVAFFWIWKDFETMHKTISISLLIGLAGANLVEILFGFMARCGVKLAELFFRILGGA